MPSQTKCKGMQYPSGHWWGHVLEVSFVDTTIKSSLVVRRPSIEGGGGVFVGFWEFVSPIKLFPVNKNTDVLNNIP